MAKTAMGYYIKERRNPQVGTYYVPYGQLSKAAAARREITLYGENYMLRYETREEYDAALKQLRADGKAVSFLNAEEGAV